MNMVKTINVGSSLRRDIVFNLLMCQNLEGDFLTGWNVLCSCLCDIQHQLCIINSKAYPVYGIRVVTVVECLLIVWFFSLCKVKYVCQLSAIKMLNILVCLNLLKYTSAKHNYSSRHDCWRRWNVSHNGEGAVYTLLPHSICTVWTKIQHNIVKLLEIKNSLYNWYLRASCRIRVEWWWLHRLTVQTETRAFCSTRELTSD